MFIYACVAYFGVFLGMHLDCKLVYLFDLKMLTKREPWSVLYVLRSKVQYVKEVMLVDGELV
jgi:hypothetical protein